MIIVAVGSLHHRGCDPFLSGLRGTTSSAISCELV